MQKIIGGVVGVIALIVVGFQVMGKNAEVDTYNDYVKQVEPIMAINDELINGIDAVDFSNEKELSANVADWMKRSADVESKFKAMELGEDWLQPLHQHMIKHSSCIHQMITAIEQYAKTKKEEHLKSMEKISSKCDKHWQEFEAAQNKLIAEKEFEVEN